MHSFTDTLGRTWPVVINVNAVRRCRGKLGIDLYGLLDENFAGLARLLGDPVSLVDVLYVLCADAATAAAITDEDFGRAMAGDCLETAADAFVAELRDFFPNPRVRAALTKLLDAGRAMRDRMLVVAMEQLEAIDPEKEADRLIASRSTVASTNSPGSSASTPAP